MSLFIGCSELGEHPEPHQPSGKSTWGRWGPGRIGTAMSRAARVCPPARRRFVVGALSLAVVTSFG
ncbi:MAG: hypothetical protein LC792_25335, partial [Actinobacteria bacterium]|nr:hypothetical protein [Actinomycetota bacterium]